MSNLRELKSKVRSEVKKVLNIDLNLFKDEIDQFSVWRRYGKGKQDFYINSKIDTFKKKLFEAHTFLLEQDIVITPTTIMFLMKLPKDWEAKLNANKTKNYKLKIELLKFYFGYIECKWEDRLSKYKEGEIMLYNKFFNHKDEVKQNAINITFSENKPRDSRIDILDDTIDLKALN